MAFLNEESLKMLEEDGEIRGAIGKEYEFKAYKLKEYSTLYRVDIYEMGKNEDDVLESLLFHRHSDKIPPGMPGGSMKVYSMQNPTNKSSRSSNGRKRAGLMEMPAMELTLEIQM